MRRTRPGYGLVEVAIACALLAAALSVTLVAVGRMAEERRSLDRRVRAAQEAANALERFLALPWPERGAESAGKAALDPEVARRLGGAKLAVKTTDVPGPPVGRKVEVVVAWDSAPESPVRLTAWTYPEPNDGGPR